MSLTGPDWQFISVCFAVGLFALILSYFSCKLALRLALRSGMISEPGERQSHQYATPTGGGLGLVFSLIVTAIIVQAFIPLPTFWWHNMLPGVLLLAGVGWLDDRRPVSNRLRLLVQLIVSIWVIGFACLDGALAQLALCMVFVVALLWLMNLYNFMDGSDGMAGFQGVFAGLVMAALFLVGDQHAMALLALIVAAVCAGFLPLNFPQASVFMGDVASVPLGFVFGAFALYGLRTGVMDLAMAILIMAVFTIDATLTLLARAIRGERWYTAHNQHIYQRLIVQGWSHSRVLMVYQAVNVLVILPAVVLEYMYPQYAFVITGVVLGLLGIGWYIAFRKLDALPARRLE